VPPITIGEIIHDARAVARAVAKNPPEKLIAPDRGEEQQADEVEEAAKTHVVYSELPIDATSTTDIYNNLLHAVRAEKPSHEYVGIDGSSRRLEAYNIFIGTYSTAVSIVDGAYLVGTHPDTGTYPAISIGDAPAASLSSDPGITLKATVTMPLIDPAALAKAINCSNPPICNSLKTLGYGRGYNVSTMLDENRVLSETYALRYASNRIASRLTRIALDGPVYMTPGLLVRYYNMARNLSYKSVAVLVETVYVLSYLLNVYKRAETILSITSKGRNRIVMGIVKRVNRSRLLLNALRMSKNLESLQSRAYTDPQLVEQILRDKHLYMHMPPYAYGVGVAIGPIISVINLAVLEKAIAGSLGLDKNPALASFMQKVARTGENLGTILQGLRSLHFLAKRSYYLVLKAHGTGYRILRVEFPQSAAEEPLHVSSGGEIAISKDTRILRRIVDNDLVVLREILWLATQPGLLEAPIPVALADRVARSVSRTVANIWYNYLKDVVSFTYDTLVQLRGG